MRSILSSSRAPLHPQISPRSCAKTRATPRSALSLCVLKALSLTSHAARCGRAGKFKGVHSRACALRGALCALCQDASACALVPCVLRAIVLLARSRVLRARWRRGLALLLAVLRQQVPGLGELAKQVSFGKGVPGASALAGPSQPLHPRPRHARRASGRACMCRARSDF